MARGFLSVGRSVLLRDGRGCWRLHVIRDGDQIGDDGSWLALEEWTWRGLRFEATGERDGAGRPSLQSMEPAIGPTGRAFHSTYLPFGWTAPTEKKAQGVA